MDATCTIQSSIHVFHLINKYVFRTLDTYLGSFKERKKYKYPFKGHEWQRQDGLNKVEASVIRRWSVISPCRASAKHTFDGGYILSQLMNQMLNRFLCFYILKPFDFRFDLRICYNSNCITRR